MINACCLALLDACVPMTTVFAAVTCGYSEDGDLLTDLTPQTEEVPCWQLDSVCKTFNIRYCNK